MQERDPRAADAGARLLVDQPQAGGAQPVERGVDVVDLVGDVVQARARAWPGTCRPACPRRAAPAARRGSRRRRAARPRRPARRPSRGARAPCRTRRGGAAIAASRSSTATPMWSMRPNTTASVPSAPRADRPRRQPRVRRRARSRSRSRRRCASAARRSRCSAARRTSSRAIGRVRRRSGSPSRAATGRSARSPSWPGRLDVPLAVIAAGTANDFARAHGLPDDLLRGGRARRHGHAHTRPLELGRLADGQPFVNVASAGLAVGRRTHARSRSSRASARSPTPSAPLRAAATAQPLRRDRARRRPRPSSRAAAGRRSSRSAARSAAARASPRPTRDDGALDVVVLPAGSRVGLARRAWGLRTQTIAQQRRRRARTRTAWSRCDLAGAAPSSTSTARCATAGSSG